LRENKLEKLDSMHPTLARILVIRDWSEDCVKGGGREIRVLERGGSTNLLQTLVRENEGNNEDFGT
jgi:hypothetical protein